MKKLLYGMLSLAILVGSAYAVAAGPMPPGGPGGPGPEGLLNRLLSLKLTDTQKHDVAVVLKKSRKAVESAVQAMDTAMQGVHDVMQAEPGNESRVRQASQKVAAAAEEMLVLRGKVEAEALAVLTPEQHKQWVEQERKMFPPRDKERFHAGRELVNEWIDMHAGKDN